MLLQINDEQDKEYTEEHLPTESPPMRSPRSPTMLQSKPVLLQIDEDHDKQHTEESLHTGSPSMRSKSPEILHSQPGVDALLPKQNHCPYRFGFVVVNEIMI